MTFLSIFSATFSGTPIHICCRSELSLICISWLLNETGERCLNVLHKLRFKQRSFHFLNLLWSEYLILISLYLTKRRQWDRLFAFGSSLSTLIFSAKDMLRGLAISGKINLSLEISFVSLSTNWLVSSLQLSRILAEKPKHNFSYFFQFIFNNISMVWFYVLASSVLHLLNQYSHTNRCQGPELVNPLLLF